MARSRQSYTANQLKEYRESINNNGVKGAVKFYDDLYDDGKGYRYAGWAVGVARNDTVTGKSATDFMIDTAKQGVGGNASRNLSTANIDKIKKDMALGYADALIANAKETGGITNQDVTYKQTRAFHKKAFEANGLSIDNWTLETPMKVIGLISGEKAVEDNWISLRETGGDRVDGVLSSIGLYKKMELVAYEPLINPTANEIKAQKLAQKWLKQVGKPYSKNNIGNFGRAILGVSSQLGGSQQSQLTAISKGPSIYWSSHKKDSMIALVVYQTMDNAVNTAKHTTFNGQPAYLLAQTTQPTCQGDATGRGGGVRSGTIGKEVKPTGGSSTIFVEGKALVRQGDTCTMNNGNTTGSYVV